MFMDFGHFFIDGLFEVSLGFHEMLVSFLERLRVFILNFYVVNLVLSRTFPRMPVRMMTPCLFVLGLGHPECLSRLERLRCFDELCAHAHRVLGGARSTAEIVLGQQILRCLSILKTKLR